MRNHLILFNLLLVSACTPMHSTDPDSMAFSLAEGSILSLNKRLVITQDQAHGTIQAGKQITDNNRNDYMINCRLDFKKLGPRFIEPENFIVTRTEDGSDWISYLGSLRFYTEVYLSSDSGTDIISMECQEYGDATDRNFTVAEMQSALGDYITFRYGSENH
ncbi:MAG TPA: hypothetical protein ENJ87_00375 [Gammaproteobacteria bacterium]|nr:hypothetical protein [Gammaproteobacteria bacterium]